MILVTIERGVLDCKDNGKDNAIEAELFEIHRPPLSDRRCDEMNTDFNEYVTVSNGVNEHSKVATGELAYKGTPQVNEVKESKP